MNPGLRFLVVAGIRGSWRRTGRRMRTARGILTTAVGGLFFLALLGTQAAVFLTDRAAPASHESVVAGVSALMLFFLVPALVAAEAPFFWPQETQFLFPGPFTRRELLLYLFLARGWVQLFSGLWLGLISARMAPVPAMAFPAVMLAVSFLFAAGNLAALAKMAVAERLSPEVRRWTRPVLWAFAVGAVAALYLQLRAEGMQAAVGAWFASPVVRAAMLPVRPFAELFAAGSAGGALLWTAVSAATVAATIAAALALDVDYRERSLATSARRFEKLRRMRSGRGGWATAAGPAERRMRVPSLALLGAAAPIARRQVYELGRGLRAFAGLVFMAAAAYFYVIVMPRWVAGESGSPGISLIVLAILFPLLATASFSVDFRRDLERLAYLRSLPLPPLAVAVGEIAVAAAVLALANLVLLAIAAATAGAPVQRELALFAVALALTAAWIAVALENWLFLLYPTRIQADGGQQSAFLGKQLLKLFVKTLVVGAAAVLVAPVAVVVSLTAGPAAAAAAAALVAVLVAAGLTLLVARAFRAFDLTLDAPA